MSIARDGRFKLYRTGEGGYLIGIRYSVTNFLGEEIDGGMCAAMYNELGILTSFEGDRESSESVFERFKSELCATELQQGLNELTTLLKQEMNQWNLEVTHIYIEKENIHVEFIISHSNHLLFQSQLNTQGFTCLTMVYDPPKGKLLIDGVFEEDEHILFEKIKNHPKVRLKMLYQKKNEEL